MTAPTQIDAGHPSLHWPADTDKDALRASMRKGYPNASDAQIEQLAKAGGMIDALCGKRMYAAPMGFAREAHTGLVHLGEDRKAA